jgi:DNA polymerase-3 subunit delta
VKFSDFKNSLESGEQFSVYLFEGEDAFFKQRGASLLKDKYILEPSLNLQEFEGEEENLDGIIASLLAYPFMSDKRMTLVKEFYPKKNEVASLEQILENPSKESLFVILNSRSCELFKKYPSVCVVDCSKADAMTIARWIKAECQNNGVSIELEVAKNLADYCQSDMTRVKNETNKLCAYVLDKGIITMADVDEMVYRDIEYKVYEMTDYIAKKNVDMALNVINDMLYKGETVQKICNSVYNYYRRLLHVAISDLSDGELAVELGRTDYVIRKMRTQAKSFKKKSLKSAVDVLCQTDYRIKSGQRPMDVETWIALFRIMTD